MRPIKMADLAGQYLRNRQEVDQAIARVLKNADFIQGEAVKELEYALSGYLGGTKVVSCANGTDALQIAMMALDFKPGDEVILPAFTYVATAEVIALLNLVPVFADVDQKTFTLDPANLEKLITKRTVAIVPVHLFGQCADMESILSFARKHSLHVIEDAAQAIGTDHVLKNGTRQKAGTLGVIGTTSFFPTKNIGAYGDGGAMFTQDEKLADKVRMIANHGQRKKYHHEIVGVNSRLDTLQAAILKVKLNHLESELTKRRSVAEYYDSHLAGLDWLRTPARASWSTHAFHQYTVLIGEHRDEVKAYLQEKSIPTMIYYPIPLHFQQAYLRKDLVLPVAENLSSGVLSLPIHAEMDEDQLSYICGAVRGFQ